MSALASMRRELRRLARDASLNGIVASTPVPPRERWRLLVALGMQVDRSYIQARCFFGSRAITIGAGTFVNYGCFFDGSAPITIGRNVRIGMQALFVTGSHESGSIEQRAGAETSSPIVVEDGAWIGARATILPGVTIGRGAIVAAGAVVTRSVDPLVTVAGIPARPVGDPGTTGRGSR